MIHVTIDGIPVEVEKGTTVLHAAKKAGIEIPTLCYIEHLLPDGSCRICVAEIESRGRKKIDTACTAQCSDGDIIETNSPAVRESRRQTLDLLLSDHKENCFSCGANGNCKLQDLCYEYGVENSSYHGEMKDFPVDDTNRFFTYDPSLCILCHRCVNTCEQLVGVQAIGTLHRGFGSVIGGSPFKKWNEGICVSCGNCVSACPVGALQPKSQNRFRYYQTEKVRTTCSYCGVGCQMDLLVRDGKIVDVEPADGPSNENLLCVKGRFGFDFVNSRSRLQTPLIRQEDGSLKEASWDEALSLVAEKIKGIRDTFGPDAIAGFSSARTVNEDNYLFQKFIRAAVGTNNVDHCARLCHSSSVAGLAMTLGSGAMTNTIADVKEAEVIFITGSNTTETHPVMGMFIRQAVREGKKLIVADPKRIELADKADVYLQINPGTSVALSNGMLHVIFEEGLEDKEYIEANTEGVEELREIVKKYTPEYTAAICGVDPELIVQAARLYASSHKSYIAFAMGITQHLNGSNNVMSMSNLALVTGNIGRPGSGVNPLRGQNNVQGACDMGALPTDYPAYQKVFLPENHEKFEKAWKARLSDKAGYTVTETIPAILEDKVKLLYIMGENPMVSDPDTNHVEAALKKAFVVVQDIFMTETCEFADVILPSTAFAEKDGTFTNTERRVQRVRRALPKKGQCRHDWEILQDVMTRIGYPTHYDKVEDIFNELRGVAPSYAGMTYARIEEKGQGCQWPCRSEEEPDTPILHVGHPIRGKGLLRAMDWEPSPETQDPDHPITLITARILYHYHTRTMTDKTWAIHDTAPQNYVELNAEFAQGLGIGDGSWVRVFNKRGEICCRASLVDSLTPGVAWMPFHYAHGANVLTDSRRLDPIAKIPGLKQVGVRIEPVTAEEAAALEAGSAELEKAYDEAERA